MRGSPVEFKTVAVKAGESAGEFVGYASTWTRTPDSYGDVVARGAFAATLADWEARGLPIPVLWGHRMDDPAMFIGTVLEAVEDDHGLKVTGLLDLDNPTGAQVHRLLRTGAVAQMSFAFDIVEDATVTLDDGTKARELRAVNLFEVSIVPVGANSDTSIEDVKTHVETLLTAEQWEVLREMADTALASRRETAPEEGEGEGNSGVVEAGQEPGKAARLEAVARLNEQVNALVWAERSTVK